MGGCFDTPRVLLTNDVTVVEDLLTWLSGQLGRTVPTSLNVSLAQLLAETVEPQAASGAAIVRQAADTMGRRLG